MPNGFENKDYGEYFKALEQSLNKSPKEELPKKEEEIQVNKPKAKRKLRKSAVAIALALVILVGSVCIISVSGKGESEPEKTPDTVSQPAEGKEEKIEKISFSFPETVPDITYGNDAACAIIIDKSTNKVIAARNPHQRAYPASTTKIMTLLVAVENITDLNDTFTMTYAITDPLFVQEASVAGFLNDETIPLIDMLYGVILPSGADACVGLAIKLAGSEDAFVELMNEKVKELGLKNTHFANTVGLHDEENYTTAYDMAVMINAAMENELCRKILSTYQYTTSVTPQHPEGILLTSTLFSHMYGSEPETATIVGGKTGFVNESGYCIASFGEGKLSGKEYIAVTLGNSSLWPAIYGQIALYKEFMQ